MIAVRSSKIGKREETWSLKILILKHLNKMYYFFEKLSAKKKKSNMVSYFLQLWYQFENNNSPFVDNDVIVATKGD